MKRRNQRSLIKLKRASIYFYVEKPCLAVAFLWLLGWFITFPVHAAWRLIKELFPKRIAIWGKIVGFSEEEGFVTLPENGLDSVPVVSQPVLTKFYKVNIEEADGTVQSVIFSKNLESYNLREGQSVQLDCLQYGSKDKDSEIYFDALLPVV